MDQVTCAGHQLGQPVGAPKTVGWSGRRLHCVDVEMARAGMVRVPLDRTLERGDELGNLRACGSAVGVVVPGPQVHDGIGVDRVCFSGGNRGHFRSTVPMALLSAESIGGRAAAGSGEYRLASAGADEVALTGRGGRGVLCAFCIVLRTVAFRVVVGADGALMLGPRAKADPPQHIAQAGNRAEFSSSRCRRRSPHRD